MAVGVGGVAWPGFCRAARSRLGLLPPLGELVLKSIEKEGGDVEEADVAESGESINVFCC